MTIQDAILRLERAGSENSKTTAKLIDATVEVANKIVAVLDAAGLDYARAGNEIRISLRKFDDKGIDCGGMEYWYRKPNYFYNNQTVHGTLYNMDPDNGFAAKLNNNAVDLGEWATDQSDVSRQDALAFAKDVADGLIGKIAEWLENRSENATRRAAELTKAGEA